MRKRSMTSLPRFIFAILVAATLSETTEAAEYVVRMITEAPKQPRGNHTRYHHETLVWGQQPAPANFPQVFFRTYTVDEVDGKLADLRNALQTDLNTKLAAQQTTIDAQRALILSLRDQLLARITQVPVELAKDEQAYRLLQQRLKKDLADTFESKRQ